MRLALKVVMKNDRDLGEVILSYIPFFIHVRCNYYENENP
jgi:hypothetical protein